MDPERQPRAPGRAARARRSAASRRHPGPSAWARLTCATATRWTAWRAVRADSAHGRRPPPARDEGRYGIHNALVFLWRLEAFPLQRSAAARVAATDPRRWTFSSLGAPTPLFTARRPEADTPGIAGEHNVRGPCDRSRSHAAPADWYGEDRRASSSRLASPSHVDVQATSPTGSARACRAGRDRRALGRIMFGTAADDDEPRVTPTATASRAQIGGGPYPRERRRDSAVADARDREADVDPLDGRGRFRRASIRVPAPASSRLSGRGRRVEPGGQRPDRDPDRGQRHATPCRRRGLVHPARRRDASS